MRVLVCGSRTWDDLGLLVKRLEQLPPDTTIIHGGASGADRIAGRYARERGLLEERYPADWKRYGKAAGPLRNLAMLDSGPDLVLAFWDGRSKGTAHTIRESERRGIPYEVLAPRQAAR